MTLVLGFEASFGHDQNGMTRADMLATLSVAEKLGEVIIFRSTGPWAKRWLERGYPSKNFHVKGKSSDWGPHAGLVPYDGTWSKVGYDGGKAAKGTHANDDGLASGFAGKTPLVLTRAQIDEQLTRAEGKPARTALLSVLPVPGSQDLFLTARRSGDQALVTFRAVKQGGDAYEIRVYANAFGSVGANPLRLLDLESKGQLPVALEVMTSREVGAGMPMTGDYDLFAVCPSWASYGSGAAGAITKPGIALDNGTVKPGLTFAPGRSMDAVLDPRLHTMGPGRPDAASKDRPLNAHDFKDRQALYAQSGKKLSDASKAVMNDKSKWTEHDDMGNLTPRILRCINALNTAMGATGQKAALRRVHHNAESHRFRAFGALTETDMLTKKDGEQYGDGFPLTVFQPSALYAGAGFGLPSARYGDVCTLESLADFQAYANTLAASGYYVPKNWIWNVQSNMPTLRKNMEAMLTAMWK